MRTVHHNAQVFRGCRIALSSRMHPNHRSPRAPWRPFFVALVKKRSRLNPMPPPKSSEMRTQRGPSNIVISHPWTSLFSLRKRPLSVGAFPGHTDRSRGSDLQPFRQDVSDWRGNMPRYSPTRCTAWPRRALVPVPGPEPSQIFSSRDPTAPYYSSQIPIRSSEM